MAINKFQEIADRFKFDFETQQVKLAGASDVDKDVVAKAKACQVKLAAALEQPDMFDEENIIFQVLKNHE